LPFAVKLRHPSPGLDAVATLFREPLLEEALEHGSDDLYLGSARIALRFDQSEQ